MSNKENGRIPQLDGIRAFAVILVVFFHINFYYGYIPVFTEIIVKGGEIGVILFFFLSGFLMTTPYIKYAIERKELYPFLKFYKDRFFRILPLLFFTSFVFLAFRNFNELNDGIDNHYTIFEYLKCAFLIDGRIIKLNPVLWTLKVEIVFYLVFPLLGFVIFQSVLKNKLPIIITLLITLCLFSMYVNLTGLTEKHSFFSEYYILLFGVMSRILLYKYGNNKLRLSTNQMLMSVVVCLQLILLYFYKYMNQDLVHFALVFVLIFFFYFLISERSYLASFISLSLFGPISKISYSIYLWHFNIHYMISVPFTRCYFSGIYSLILSHLISLSLTLLVSSISYKLIEEPFLKLKNSF